jgi:aldehyde dehydrogenase (NAD(P)+)
MTQTVLSGRNDLDAAIADLKRGEVTWAATSVRRRRELLEQIQALTDIHADAWVAAAVGIKGLPAGSPLVGEEWISGPYPLLGGTAALAATLRALEQGRSPLDGYHVGRGPGGRVVIRVLPHTIYDRLLLHGFSTEVWMPPGVDEQSVRTSAGLGELDPTRTQGVSVVLGAGNITSIPPLDVLHELYANNRVVLLKLNPLTDPLLPVFQKIFAPLVSLGVLRIVAGAADVGTYLVHHGDVSHVHLTGSVATHDAIMFGAGEEGRRRKAGNRPLLTKGITSELGGVSPIIVLPGKWSAADLKFQAEHVATQRLHNDGYNCVAGQVVVLSADWAQKEAFLAALRSAVDRAPARPHYYPGSDQRVADALAAYPAAQRLGKDKGRVLAAGGSPEERTHMLTTEYFAPVLGVIELPGAGQTFLTSAVRTANDDFVGTLGVNLIAHPRTLRELGGAFGQALVDLRYGCVAVNTWTGLGFLSPTASWGGFPGATVDHVESGIGVVHNALLLDSPERVVVRGPFRPSPRSLLHGEFTISPKPPWFVTNRTAATTGRRLTAFAASPSWGKLPGLFASALRG